MWPMWFIVAYEMWREKKKNRTTMSKMFENRTGEVINFFFKLYYYLIRFFSEIWTLLRKNYTWFGAILTFVKSKQTNREAWGEERFRTDELSQIRNAMINLIVKSELVKIDGVKPNNNERIIHFWIWFFILLF